MNNGRAEKNKKKTESKLSLSSLRPNYAAVGAMGTFIHTSVAMAMQAFIQMLEFQSKYRVFLDADNESNEVFERVIDSGG